ncbi:MAG: hypothetical protein KIT69_04010, partial [Propionibacteriaceae bacterium]|nr:hypothetical protein [Propionibacteriaceae bacterium]
MSDALSGEGLFGEKHPNPTALLTSLAIINVNWEHHRRSYLDNFVPFAVEAMRSRADQSWTEAEVRDGLALTFGLLIPTRVVGSLLRRAANRGLASRRQNRFSLTSAGQQIDAAQTFGTLQAECRRQQRSLADALVDMAAQRFNLSWSAEDAEEALAAFIEGHAVPLLAAATRGSGYEPTDGQAGRDYVVSVFVADVVKRDPARFGYLDQMVKGSMLASALYLEVQADVDRKFANTTLYLDTPVLLKSLGLEGPEAEQAGRQVIAMALGQDARVACFEHTLTETRRVLESAKAALASPRHRREGNGVLMHFRAINASPSDLDLVIARLERKIADLGARVLPSPDHSERLGVDEAGLESMLQRRVGYHHRESLLIDLDSLTSVHRVRQGAAPRQLERCRALLVTDNDRLVSTGRDFFDRTAHEWPVAILENDLAALLWVKEPQRFPDVPRVQVIADCMAALSPSQPLWSKVTEEIDRLQTRGEITEGDVAILRFSH